MYYGALILKFYGGGGVIIVPLFQRNGCWRGRNSTLTLENKGLRKFFARPDQRLVDPRIVRVKLSLQ
jgi:hypothetical protein